MSEHLASEGPHCPCRGLLEISAQMFEEQAGQLAAAEARAARILDAYHQSYRHGPDPDPKRCPGCHAAALEDL